MGYLKDHTEYIFETGSPINSDGSIPMNRVGELVRCKDCAKWGLYKCPLYTSVHANDFCSKAIRKDEGK